MITLGTGLVGAAVLLSTVFTHARGSLDASNFVLGLLGALGLLGLAVAAYLLVREPARRTALAAYPGAVGTAAAGLVLLTAADFDAASQWLAGLLTLALAAVGYGLTRQVPYVVAGICGLALFVAKLVMQLTGLTSAHVTSGHVPGHLLIWISLGLWAFTEVVTAGAWFLPGFLPGRHIVAVWLGSVALAGNIVAMLVLYVVALIVKALTGSLVGLVSGGPSRSSFYSNGDVAVTLIFTAVAIVGWAYLYFVSGVAGYRVLMLSAGAYIPAVAAVVIAVSHPSVWELVLGILGGAMLVGVLALSVGRRSGTPTGPMSAPPSRPATSQDGAPGRAAPTYPAPTYPAPGSHAPGVPGTYPPARPPAYPPRSEREAFGPPPD